MKSIKYKKGSFITVPNKEILKGATPKAQCVFMWLCSFADEEGVCYPSKTKLAEYAGLTTRAVFDACDELIKLGVLEKVTRKEGKKNLTNIYQIIIKEEGGMEYSSIGMETGSIGGMEPIAEQLNPLSLTQSNIRQNNETGVSSDVSEEEENAEEPRGVATTTSFEEFLGDRGFKKDSLVDESGNTYTFIVHEDNSSRAISKQKEKELKNEYKKLTNKEPKARPTNFMVAQKLTNMISKSLDKQYDATPLIGVKEVDAIKRNIIEKFGPNFVEKYSKWFFENNEIDKKFKFSIFPFTSNSFINKFIAETNTKQNE